MKVRRLPNNTVDRPGRTFASTLIMSEEAANDIPRKTIAESLYASIYRRFEQAPKRLSRGPYALGPVRDIVGPRTGGGLFEMGKVAYIARADVVKGVEV